METSAVAGDQDQQWLLNCLSATLDPNQEVRSFAEASLNQASLQPGFGAALSKVAANREISFGLRQLAAVLLKHFIKKHWQEGEESFELPAVSSEEKEVIRKLLLSSLDDTHRKICTAISMAVASIAAYDWPEDWPDLLPFLLKLITDQSNMNGVHGGLRCLALLSADLDDATVPKLVPVLFPVLHTIVSFPESYDRYVRTKALSIVYSCTAMLGVMSGVCKTEMFALMMPMLKPWMNRFSIILEHPVQPEDPDDWGIKMEVLKCLNQFIQNFPSLAESEFLVVVRPLWQTFVSSLRVYTRSSIEGTEDPYAGRYDSDGAEKSLDSFVVQLFEFLLTIVGSAKLVKVIASNVRELVYHTIAFLQMTEQQIHIWSIDANQFLADEDESTYSCRVSGALLLEEVVSYCGREGIDAIIDAASKRFNESQQEKAAGSTVWWRMREATLFALAFLSEQLLEAEVSGLTSVRLGELLEQMITEDIGTGVHQYPFLYARIFASVARFSSAISDGVLEHFLSAAITTIAMDVPPPVKVGACRALSELLPKANKGNFQPQMMGLFSSLADLLHQARDETLHLVLETLQAAIKAGFLTASMEPMISPLILNIWALHVSDPFISIDAIEVLEAIKCSPGCIHQLASRILPYVGPILNNPQQQPDGLVAGSLDLLTMLLKSASTDVVKAAYDVCFDAVIQIILQSEDHSEMQNATECLATFICGGRQPERAASDDEPFAGLAFKIMSDPFVGSLTFVRVYAGKLSAGSYVLNANKGKKERIGRLLEMHANSREDVKVALAGDIIALAGLKDTITGETLCDADHPILLERMDFPDPVIKVAIEPKTKADIDKMANGLIKLAQEDPSFHFSRDEEINQTVIEGMGELHLEIIVDRLKREFKVEANVGAPQVNYRESISKVSEVKYVHKKQSGGQGQFADITVRFEPMEAGSGYEFKSEIKGGAVPKEYIPGVMKGLEECMSNGVLAGFPVVDVRAALVDGSYHDVDSSVLAFQLAARGAFREGMRKAGPKMLEPIMKVEVVTPEEHLGDVIGDLNSRRGQINSFGDKPGGLKVVDALVPLAEMFQYVSALRGMTKGRASYIMQLAKFDVVPQHIQNQLAAKEQEVAA